MSNFNYCSLVWNFSSAQSLNKIENLQKRALYFLLNDYGSIYEDIHLFRYSFIWFRLAVDKGFPFYR